MFPYEGRLLQAVNEVCESPDFDVEYKNVGPGAPGYDPSRLFESMAERGFPLSERIRRAYFPYRNVALQWRYGEGDESIVGEFDVMNIDASSEEPLDDVEDFANSESGLALLSELSVLDDVSRGGGGELAAVRFVQGVSSPEIWYINRSNVLVRLDLDYRDYLDNLCIMKGAMGWQYLFAEVVTGDREYDARMGYLKGVLEVLPRYFPNYDYAPLVARLEARL